ncbi:hypothetical protein C2S51_007696 [Perilla frutescens var. frutescens]|nr:hypothetical protein C2S51_007696 [Perilla frutescens var. frutescens]
MLVQLRLHLDRAQQRMKASADKSMRDVQFEASDMVFVKLHFHRQDAALPEELGIEGPFFEPKTALRYRDVWRGNDRVPQVLIQWKGQAESEATWVDEADVRGQFPEFTGLGDKAVLLGEGVDRDSRMRVYTRQSG